MFPEEKIRNEVATIRYIQDHTAIPVPFILHWGTREESPLGIGPFIIMDYINHEMNMTAALNTPGLTLDIPPVLYPNIDEAKLEMLYRQVASILLQLSKLELPLIGALEETHERSWEVTRRPLSMPMNELVRTGTFPRAKLPTSTFKTSSEYFQALANLHVDHLANQRNDAIESRADCQRKYTARQLFQKLAYERKLVSDRYDKGPFKFWCDDLRPSNILLDANLQIVAVIDWEFSYAAPSEFTFAPPWWLLIEQPEYWEKGLDDWVQQYERRLTTFLKAMGDCEDASIAAGQLLEEQRLSGKMRESWASGDFWTVYAARRNFAFDGVFWEKLDPRFFGRGEGASGPGDAWMERLELLDEKARAAMEAFVDRKVAESETRELAWEPDEVL
ncbi:aminoglycoside 3'-phosphotransferase/choline kinase domain protein [Metarhizium robertsii]|uniref:Pep1-1 n=2 Tax=Metarhizium robertsii TaxID=568076 RepID=A0A0B2X7X0_METRA|nr:pep1-1 [Metarhizium robertsii ARSEF 23]EXV02166.1 aminoglycoside 3'-phosphotransferase/choline kinase domain protein [Metarhizium robertsii]KHO10998.1 pep1-1 [Metarhizium robertsii ARSEF 23]